MSGALTIADAIRRGQEQQEAGGAVFRGLDVHIPEGQEERAPLSCLDPPLTGCVVGIGAGVVLGGQRPAVRRQHRMATSVPWNTTGLGLVQTPVACWPFSQDVTQLDMPSRSEC